MERSQHCAEFAHLSPNKLSSTNCENESNISSPSTHEELGFTTQRKGASYFFHLVVETQTFPVSQRSFFNIKLKQLILILAVNIWKSFMLNILGEAMFKWILTVQQGKIKYIKVKQTSPNKPYHTDEFISNWLYQ